jgi:hypothetical protein
MKNKKKTFKTKATTTTITALLPTTTTATRGGNSGNRSAIVASGSGGTPLSKYFVTHFRVTLPVLKTGTEKQSREERRPAYSTFSTYGQFCSPENCSSPVYSLRARIQKIQKNQHQHNQQTNNSSSEEPPRRQPL